MTKIRIQTESVREAGQRFIAEGDHLAEIGQALQGAIGSLDTWAWDGVSRARAEPLLGRVRPESTAVAEELERLGRTLVRVADVFEQEDNTAAGNLEGLEWVVFVAAETAIGAASADSEEGQSERPKLNNMQDLYKSVKDVDDRKPIKIVQIGDNEYLILLEGTSDKGGHNWGSAVQAGLGMSSTYERQVRKYISEHVPEGATLHFAGHSQGGIVAENVADNQDFRDHYNIASVTTFGSPTSAYEDQGTEYRHYAAQYDPVPMLDRDALAVIGISSVVHFGYLSSKAQKRVSGANLNPLDPFASHGYYDRAPELLEEGLPFEVKEWKEVGSYEVKPQDGMSYAWQNLKSDNLFNKACGAIDLVTEGGKYLVLAKVDVGIETVSSQFPEPIRDSIDRYKDRAYDKIAELPTPTQAAGGVVNFAKDKAEAAMDFSNEMAEKTGRAAGDVANFAKDKAEAAMDFSSEMGKKTGEFFSSVFKL